MTNTTEGTVSMREWGGAGETAAVRRLPRGSVSCLGARTILFLVLPTLLLGCGIETLPYVAAPKEDEADWDIDPAFITFRHNDEDNDSDEFRGYELYYKLYEDENGSTGCREADKPCNDDYEAILRDPVPTGTSRLTGRGYVRMIAGENPGEIPGITVSLANRGDEFDVDIYLTAGTDEDRDTARAEWPNGPQDLNRNVPSASDGFKRFLATEDYDDDDDDLSAIDSEISDVIGNDNLYMAVYALGYGIDPASLQEIYSRPVFLGYVRLEPEGGG
ncbi:MAG: hypothetical protein ACLFS5_09940 [Spirochaetaceae bacterium]